MFNNKDYDRLMIKGKTKFQEISFNQSRILQPKLNIIKLKGFQQLVDLIKQQETIQKNFTDPQIITQSILPQVKTQEIPVGSKKEIRVTLRKISEQRIHGKKSFTESVESSSLERKISDIKRQKFTIKKAIPLKVEDITLGEDPTDFSSLIGYTNQLKVIPQEKINYKTFITKGNNGILVRQLIKTRSWWSILESPQKDMNLYWTQLRKQNFYEDLIYFSGQQSHFNKQQIKILNEKLNYKQEDQKCLIFTSSNILRVHNHLEGNFQISNKKALYYNMKSYYSSLKQDPFNFIPLTFHIQDGIKDPVYIQFEEYAKKNTNSIWIIKPGEQSNRGNGIEISNSILQVKRLVSYKEIHQNGIRKTFIVQQYISNPLLYNKRKFDIRCFLLVTCVNHKFKAYFYQEGYIRTSSKEFNLNDIECKYTHLTNDAVQKYSKQYGKFETGNKVSFNDFSKYLFENYQQNFNPIINQIKQLALDIVKATNVHLDPNQHFYSFELFGLDFMIDNEFKPWLIEVNTNPCIETSCPLLTRLITHVVENTIRIAIDPMFPPPSRKKPLPELKNNFELIFECTQTEQPHLLPKIQQDDDDQDLDDDN